MTWWVWILVGAAFVPVVFAVLHALCIEFGDKIMEWL